MDIKQKTKDTSNVDAYLKMWQMISNSQLDGVRFIRQVLVEPFIVDFACIELKVIVELDTVVNTDRQDCEQRRTKYLQSKGYAVLRFWCNEVLSNTTKVTLALRRALCLS